MFKWYHFRIKWYPFGIKWFHLEIQSDIAKLVKNCKTGIDQLLKLSDMT